jgi:hypothetical protein
MEQGRRLPGSWAEYPCCVSALVPVCGAMFDGISEQIGGRTEILVRDGMISEIGRSVHRPDGAKVIDLSDPRSARGSSTTIHLTMDASDLAPQTLQSYAAKALKARSLAREYMRYGFTTLRDLRSMDPESYGSDWIVRRHPGVPASSRRQQTIRRN